MRTPFTIIILIILARTVHSQEIVYWANGNSFPFKIVEATESVVKIGEIKGERIVKRSLPRENVLVAFNAKGNYIMIANLDTNPIKATQQIQDFYKDHGPKYDLLIQTNPVRVIECEISYKSDEIINYKTLQGTPGSIPKKELALIIFREGQHEFMCPVAEAALILQEAHPQIQKIINQPSPKFISPTEANVPPAVNFTYEANKKTPLSTDTKSELPSEELSQYSKRGIRKVDEFVQYLNIISDKSIDPDKKDEAIDQAIKLFLPGATIDVTSSNYPGVKRHSVKNYLTRLKLLPYSSASISWNEIHYIKELSKESDGSYYGTITGSQTFTGYGANGHDVMYSDVTKKSVKVKLQSYQKSIEGQQTTEWEILLGNIGVSVK